jgi:hypothetical protein
MRKGQCRQGSVGVIELGYFGDGAVLNGSRCMIEKPGQRKQNRE